MWNACLTHMNMASNPFFSPEFPATCWRSASDVILPAQNARPTAEEMLFGGESGDISRTRFSGDSTLIWIVRNGESGDIADALAGGQSAVNQ